MNIAASQQYSYALGHSELELECLAHQAQLFAPFTRQLFEQAGIVPDMRILDVGCSWRRRLSGRRVSRTKR
jgi:cyclopropane fatty-acyl-phospholipid synthase-like methyltransferase